MPDMPAYCRRNSIESRTDEAKWLDEYFAKQITRDELIRRLEDKYLTDPYNPPAKKEHTE